jgi:hypothetical protein
METSAATGMAVDMSMADAHDSKKHGEQRPRSSVRAGPRRKAAAPAQPAKSSAAAGAQQVGMVLVWWGCSMHVCSCRPPCHQQHSR